MKRKIAFVIMLAMLVAFYITSNPMYIILFLIAGLLYFAISMIFYGGLH